VLGAIIPQGLGTPPEGVRCDVGECPSQWCPIGFDVLRDNQFLNEAGDEPLHKALSRRGPGARPRIDDGIVELYRGANWDSAVIHTNN
jgi:hypothetical protein